MASTEISNTPLTAIILTHRSDDIFLYSLASIQWADEVLLIDYDSGNDWEALKKRFHFKVIAKDSKRIVDFAKERNNALKEAKNEWCLFLDSDEVVNVDSNINNGNDKDHCGKNNIKETITYADENNYSGIIIKREDIFRGKVMEWGEVRNVNICRIMKKNKARYKRDVHEQVEINGEILKSDIVISHYSHNSIKSFLSDIYKYAELDADYKIKLNNFPKNNLFLVFKMIFYPFFKFIYTFFIKLGILDGWRGFIYSYIMSLHSIIVRITIYEKLK